MLRIGGTSSQLPVEMLHMISQYIGGNEHCLSLALSGRLQGFASFYGRERGRYGIFLGPGCYYLTPNSWDAFFTKYIYPDSISKFCANHCYWLPGQWLCDNILKLKNLQDLSIKDTQICLQQISKVLGTCHKVAKLDFSYEHEEAFLQTLVEHPLSAPLVVEALKRLTHLKITTFVQDARDYTNDPWVFIIKTLSLCQKCIELTINIRYHGIFEEYEEETGLSSYETEVERYFLEALFPRLIWMKSLKSLVLQHDGSFNWENTRYRSRLFDHLFQQMFGNDPHLPNSLVHLWIASFHFPDELLGPVLSIVGPSMKTYRLAERVEELQDFNEFRNLEHIGFIRFRSMEHLPNLKSAYGCFEEHSNPQELIDFIRSHPNLEHLTVHYNRPPSPDGQEEIPFYVPNSELHLLELKSLCFISNSFKKEMVEEFVKVYPNLKTLFLESRLPMAASSDEKVRVDEESIAAIRFQHLTSLGLAGFHLDGSFLQQVITNCSKLEVLHLKENSIQPNSSFFLNLKLFIGSAEKLRDISLEFDHQHTDVSDALSVFNSLLPCASHLERIFIIWKAFPDVSLEHPLTESIINFAQKMERLVALCLVFRRLGDDNVRDDSNDDVDDDANVALMEQINQRMEKEVLPTRSALWFHLDSEFPYVTDVPLIHYQELINADRWNPPIEF